MGEGGANGLRSVLALRQSVDLSRHPVSRGEIPAPVLVILGDLLPWPRIEARALGDRRLPERQCLGPEAFALGAAAQPQQEPLPQRTADPSRQRRLVTASPARLIGALPEAAEPDVLLGGEIEPLRVGERPGHPARQRDERQDVQAVVLEHGLERLGAAAPEIVEVERGDQGARHIVNALQAQDARLDRSEAAVREPGRPEPSCRRQEIQVREMLGPGTAGEDEAGLEERKVEPAAVVGHHAVEVGQQRGHGGDQRRLLVQIAHEVLGEHEPIALEEARPDEKGVGPRAAGEAGGLRVQVEEALRRRLRRGLPAQEPEDVGRRFERRSQGELAVAVMELVFVPRDEEAAV